MKKAGSSWLGMVGSLFKWLLPGFITQPFKWVFNYSEDEEHKPKKVSVIEASHTPVQEREVGPLPVVAAGAESARSTSSQLNKEMAETKARLAAIEERMAARRRREAERREKRAAMPVQVHRVDEKEEEEEKEEAPRKQLQRKEAEERARFYEGERKTNGVKLEHIEREIHDLLGLYRLLQKDISEKKRDVKGAAAGAEEQEYLALLKKQFEQVNTEIERLKEVREKVVEEQGRLVEEEHAEVVVSTASGLSLPMQEGRVHASAAAAEEEAAVEVLEVKPRTAATKHSVRVAPQSLPGMMPWSLAQCGAQEEEEFDDLGASEHTRYSLSSGSSDDGFEVEEDVVAANVAGAKRVATLKREVEELERQENSQAEDLKLLEEEQKKAAEERKTLAVAEKHARNSAARRAIHSCRHHTAEAQRNLSRAKGYANANLTGKTFAAWKEEFVKAKKEKAPEEEARRQAKEEARRQAAERAKEAAIEEEKAKLAAQALDEERIREDRERSGMFAEEDRVQKQAEEVKRGRAEDRHRLEDGIRAERQRQERVKDARLKLLNVSRRRKVTSTRRDLPPGGLFMPSPPGMPLRAVTSSTVAQQVSAKEGSPSVATPPRAMPDLRSTLLLRLPEYARCDVQEHPRQKECVSPEVERRSDAVHDGTYSLGLRTGRRWYHAQGGGVSGDALSPQPSPPQQRCKGGRLQIAFPGTVPTSHRGSKQDELRGGGGDFKPDMRRCPAMVGNPPSQGQVRKSALPQLAPSPKHNFGSGGSFPRDFWKKLTTVVAPDSSGPRVAMRAWG